MMAVRSGWNSGQLGLQLDVHPRIFRVSELNEAIQRHFSSEFHGIRVSGEISGCRVAPSGHFYFVLKESQSQIKCALFKGTARFARFKPQDGLAVVARGNLEVYDARGEYQLIVDFLEPQGTGALQLAFEQLKRKLEAEGLFARERKRPLPKLPKRIGIVTSPAGAVIQDMLHVLERRFPGLHIRLFPALVQGEGASEQVCAGIQYFSSSQWAEVVLLARGGGSLEDLWTFNEESVARAIAACAIPVISAIGHETDFTISDFVADHRAPTPSAAAEIVVCTLNELLQQIEGFRAKALQAMRYRLLMAARDLHTKGAEGAGSLVERHLRRKSQQIDDLDAELRNGVRRLLESQSRRLLDLTTRLRGADLRIALSKAGNRRATLESRLLEVIRRAVWKRRNQCATAGAHLEQLSPLAVLSRGYALVTRKDGPVVRSPEEVATGDELLVRLRHGRLRVSVEEREGADKETPGPPWKVVTPA
jgi:exodeoxyribonuclease VII large subunit